MANYFNLRHDDRGGAPAQVLQWLPQYAAVAVGVLAQPFLDAYKQGHASDFHPSWAWLLFTILVALLIFPAVYRRAWDPDTPIFVQCCSIFAAGVGWQSLVQAGWKLGKGVVPEMAPKSADLLLTLVTRFWQ